MLKKKRIKEEKGVTLVLTFLLIVVILVLGSVILNISLGEYKKADREKNEIKAYYLARSGAKIVADSIMNIDIDPKEKFPTPGSVYTYEVRQDDADGAVIIDQVKVTTKSSGYIVESIAEVKNVSEKVKLEIKKNFIPKFEHTIYAKDSLSIGKDNQATLDIGGSEGIASEGLIIVDESQEDEEWYDDGNSVKEGISYDFPELDFPEDLSGEADWNGEQINTTPVYYNDMGIEPADTLTVNSGGDAIDIYVRKLSLKGSIVINGGGIVNFFITGDDEISYVQTPNVDAEDIFFYLKENVTLQLIANSTTNGYIYGPNAQVLMNSSKTTLNGAVISNILYKTVSSETFSGEINYVDPSNLDNFLKHAKQYEIVKWSR